MHEFSTLCTRHSQPIYLQQDTERQVTQMRLLIAYFVSDYETVNQKSSMNFKAQRTRDPWISWQLIPGLFQARFYRAGPLP